MVWVPVAVVVVVVPVELTETVPLISFWWTVHQNVYTPGWAKMHVPLHLLPDAAAVMPTGTPALQLGVAGPLFHSTPCGTVSLGLLKLTTPLAFTLAVGGFQRWDSPYMPPSSTASIDGAASELATAGSTTAAAPSSPVRNSSSPRAPRACPRILISHQDAAAGEILPGATVA